jgi:lipid-binding SYLF domain-containing protein
MFADAGISNMFNSAYGYALFPTIGKAGFLVGGAYGKGRVYDNLVVQVSVRSCFSGTNELSVRSSMVTSSSVLKLRSPP